MLMTFELLWIPVQLGHFFFLKLFPVMLGISDALMRVILQIQEWIPLQYEIIILLILQAVWAAEMRNAVSGSVGTL